MTTTSILDLTTTSLRTIVNRQTSSMVLQKARPIFRLDRGAEGILLVQRQGRSTVLVKVGPSTIEIFRGEPCGWMQLAADGTPCKVDGVDAFHLQRAASWCMKVYGAA
jgi:hypothetical protein